MSLKKQREMEEEEMRKQGGRWVATTSTHCLSCPTYIISSHLLNCDRSVGRRGGGRRENRQRQEGGEKVEKVGFSFSLLLDMFSLLCFEGEEDVGRVRKPNSEQGVHEAVR